MTPRSFPPPTPAPSNFSRDNGLRYSEAVKQEIDAICDGPCRRDQLCVSYYLGVQMGYRVAKRLQV